MADKVKTNVNTPKAMLSYPHIFEPVKDEKSGQFQYSACLVFAPGADLTELRNVAKAVATEKWKGDAVGMARDGQIRLPFRSDAVAKGYPEGSIFINVKSTRKPEVVGRYKGADGNPVALNDPDVVYPGCYVRASLRAFAYDTSGNKGVSFALCNVQKLEDGERLDGRRRAADDFDAEEQPDDWGAPEAPAAAPAEAASQAAPAPAAPAAPASNLPDPFGE